MKLSEIKQILKTLDTVEFQLEDGSFVPEHFHVTEVGQSNKHFIDCEGVMWTENRVNFSSPPTPQQRYFLLYFLA